MSRYFVTVARGLEAVAAQELNALGSTKTECVPGGVYFDGDQDTLYRAHLWLRTGNRILLPLREFPAMNTDELYEGISKFRWETFLTEDKTFAVDCKVSGRFIQELSHSQYVMLRVKDAIVDRMRDKTGSRPNVDVENPDISIVVYIRDGHCTLNMDATGGSLHARGYRLPGMPAPLKETLAAGLIALSEWDGICPFIDPMCGSGTLPIEATLKAANVAPGLLRDHFAFMNWPDFFEERWDKLRNEALEKVKPIPPGLIYGFDQDESILEAARESAALARISEGKIEFLCRRFEEFSLPENTPPGVLIVNPPYGERLGEDEKELQALYKLMGDTFKHKLKGWRAYIFTGNLELAKHVGLKASRRFELYNGAIECRLLKYEMY